MDELPHRITIRCDDGRKLAHHLMRDLPIEGVELIGDNDELSVLTHQPGAFYQGLASVVGEAGVSVRELVSADDNLEAVFNYLISAD